VETPIVNDLQELQKELSAVPTIVSATDEQLVAELQKRGYTGNLIRKTSFIL
jgi:hypothetical protein